MATALFFTTSTGNSEDVADKIAKQLGDIEVFNIANCGVDKINEFDKVIIGGSTWGDGDLNDDLDEAWDDFAAIDFTGKTAALFCLGDQEGYGDTFCDALGTVYEQIKNAGGEVVGFTSTDGYEYDESKGEIDGEFAGLVIDEDNQDDLSDERIEAWAELIKGDIL